MSKFFGAVLTNTKNDYEKMKPSITVFKSHQLQTFTAA